MYKKFYTQIKVELFTPECEVELFVPTMYEKIYYTQIKSRTFRRLHVQKVLNPGERRVFVVIAMYERMIYILMKVELFVTTMYKKLYYSGYQSRTTFCRLVHVQNVQSHLWRQLWVGMGEKTMEKENRL